MPDNGAGENGEDDLERGRQYRYDDGVAEAVVATEKGRVLAVREYPSEERFREEVSAAVATEFNEVLADIDAEAIMGEVRGDAPTDPAGDASGGTGAAASGTESVAPAGAKDPDEESDASDESNEPDSPE